MVRKFVIAMIALALFIPFSIGYGLEQSNDLQEITGLSTLDSKYSNLLLFVESYNAIAQTPIQSIKELDISRGSEHYRTEFRLNAFQNAPALAGVMGDNSIEMINTNYEGFFGSDLRVYALVNSLDATTDIFESFCNACNPKITEEDFNEFYEFHRLDSGDCRIVIKNISGYVMVKDGYFDILLDGSPDYFDIE